MPEESDRGLRLLLVVVLLVIVVSGVVDLVLDAPDTLLSGHVIYEVSLIAAALFAVGALGRGWRRDRQSLVVARRALEQHRAERDVWRESARHALEGLGHAIDERFGAWGLTPAEREIAMLLLKGKSHKEIAYSTGRSERTVRQHAVSVYQKSGLGGRAELSAFFLEDLILPGAGGAPAPAAAGARSTAG